MPIKLACGGCNAVLNAPDSAVGKRVKCPKCGVLLIIPTPEPEFEMVEEEPVPVPTAKRKPAVIHDDDEEDEEPKPVKRKAKVTVEEDEDDEPRKAKRRRRDEDDDEEEEDEAPRRKRGRGKKEKPKSKLLLILGIVFGVSLLLGIVGTVIGLMMGGSGAKPTTPGSSAVPISNIPAGWMEFKQPEFEMLVPSEGPAMEDKWATLPANSPARAAVPVGGKFFDKDVVNPDRGVALLIVPLNPTALAESTRNAQEFLDTNVARIAAAGATRPDLIAQKTAGTLSGLAGRAYIINSPEGKIYGRAIVTNGRLYVLFAGGKGLDDNSEHVKTIFDNFKVKP